MLESLIGLITSSPGALIGALIGIFIAIIPMLKDSVESTWKKRFREQVRSGILNGSLKPDDMPHFHERWSQDRQSVLFSLRLLLSEAISAEDEKLKDKADDIRILISNHVEREPFSELPENISLQLSGIRKENPEINGEITQLASSLNELYSSNKTELSKQKRLSFWGVVVGIIGVLISIASLYIALPVKT